MHLCIHLCIGKCEEATSVCRSALYACIEMISSKGMLYRRRLYISYDNLKYNAFIGSHIVGLYLALAWRRKSDLDRSSQPEYLDLP